MTEVWLENITIKDNIGNEVEVDMLITVGELGSVLSRFGFKIVRDE